MPEEPMTFHLEDALRRSVEAGNRRDDVAALAMFTRDAVWDMSRGGLGVIEGREAIRAFFKDWWSAYEEYDAEVEEIQDLGNGVAFAVFVQRGRPLGSTRWVEFRDARVLVWGVELIERVTTFLNVDEARAAAERLAEERRKGRQRQRRI